MNTTLSRLISNLAALTVGLFFGFFLVLNAIFSDIFSLGERLLTFALVLIIYSLAGFIWGYFYPGKSWRWSYWLAGPAVLFVLVFSLSEYERLLLHLFYLILTVGSAGGGAYFGSRRSKKA
ncbi:MAG: hypothetical protein SCK29_08760 [Bacillota bacterium]|nr:hypothetical protein [Bacillota bacterium]MDW7684189.1 hypothetical protein [Bacillota bacterium]